MQLIKYPEHNQIFFQLSLIFFPALLQSSQFSNFIIIWDHQSDNVASFDQQRDDRFFRFSGILDYHEMYSSSKWITHAFHVLRWHFHLNEKELAFRLLLLASSPFLERTHLWLGIFLFSFPATIEYLWNKCEMITAAAETKWEGEERTGKEKNT